MTIHTPKTECLRCRKKLDAASYIKDESKSPVPGDVTICMYCGYLMAFTDDMTFRELTEEEIKEVPLVEVARIQRARKAVMDS